MPIDIQKVHMLALHSPRGANAIIGQLCILVGSVPALDYMIEAPRLFTRGIELQPFPFHNDPGGRLRILLELCNKIIFCHSPARGFELARREKSRLQYLPSLAIEVLT